MEITDCEKATPEILRIAVAQEHNISEDFVTVTNIKVKSGSRKGDGFTCQIAALEFDAIVDGQKLSKNYIAKYSSGGRRSEILKQLESFDHEVPTYTWLIPKLQDIRSVNNLNQLAIPQCFYASADKELILLEDLKVKGYQGITKNPQLLSPGTIKLVLHELAAFHATGFHFVETYPGGFDVLVNDYPNILPPNSDGKKKNNEIYWLEVTGVMFGNVVKIVKKFLSEEMFKRMEIFGKKIPDVMTEIFTKKTELKYIVHGDAWYNNYLYRPSAENPLEFTDVMMVDLQNTRLGRPGVELAYFICSSTTHEVRTENLDDFISFYYDSFIEELTKMGGDTQSPPFTIEELRIDFDECYPFGFVQGLGHAQVMLVQDGSEAKFDLENLWGGNKTKKMLEDLSMQVMAKAESSVEYRKLILGLVEEAAIKNII